MAMTYQQLVANFIQKGAPGANGAAAYSPAFNDAYNNYYSQIADAHGVGSFEEIDPSWTATATATGTSGSSVAPALPSVGTQGTDQQVATATLPGTTFVEAPAPAASGNYNQTQNATQGGQFATVGQSQQEQSQTSGGTTQGTTTTTPNDTLGFGALLQQQAAGATASDAARTAFLTDLMENGGTGFQSQLDQGIRNSLTGPQMTGAGDSARARAAGYGAAEVGRTNLNARLGAANELATPGSLASLSTAANPYIGSTQTATGSTTGFSDLISKAVESQAGSTAGQSSQAGAGQIPQGQPVKTGGCVLCTAGIELGIWPWKRVLRHVIDYKLTKAWPEFRSAARGYFAVFTPVARWLLTHPRTASVLLPVAKAVVYEELRVSGRQLPLRRMAWVVHWLGHSICAAVGHLPVRGYVTDEKIVEIARRNNVLFAVKEDK